jgi:hypothetical protein
VLSYPLQDCLMYYYIILYYIPKVLRPIFLKIYRAVVLYLIVLICLLIKLFLSLSFWEAVIDGVRRGLLNDWCHL